ncbi:MAG: glycosyltransferase family 2 protein [Deltaproteobacteria bacterium]|nr:glycosyltransferase family 2 protein [Deltaproteobacteria bacterium]
MDAPASTPRLPTLLSVVVPLYNEQAIVAPLCERLLAQLSRLGCPYEIVAVDDGSRDGTRRLLTEQAKAHPVFRVICLSRNFGLQAAVAAGLAHAKGDVIVLMDGDLQDPPELIPQLLEEWQKGAEVVFTTKKSRAETGLRRLAMDAFHAIFQRMGDIPLPLGAGNFSLIDQRALAVINALPEHNRYLPGIRSWVGFKQAEVAFARDARAAGEPRMSLRRLTKLALDGIFGFSYLPLRAATVVGFAACLLGLLLILWVLVERFITQTAILGWPSVVIAVCLLGGAQLVSLGILGEYIGRIYDEVRGRPNFVVSEVLRFDEPQQGGR